MIHLNSRTSIRIAELPWPSLFPYASSVERSIAEKMLTTR
jgi:hypothetical protein